VNPETLALDPDALRRCVDERTAALVIGNLFGWPEPTTSLQWLEGLGVVVVDDAAQAFGAREGGRLVGQRSRLGVLSFGRGKCVSLGDGGALLVNDPALTAPASIAGAGGRGFREWVLAIAVSVSRSRVALGCLARLPGARLGESHFEPTFVTRSAPASVRAMAVDLQGLAERASMVRRGVASAWRDALADATWLRGPPESAGNEPAFLRYPVRASSRAQREALVVQLSRAGFRYVRSYPEPLGGIPGFATMLAERTPTRGAQELADRVVALPCHCGVEPDDIQRAARAIGSVER
jgi:dTDP-4-amino-4,6-dideoxygalactose transaminase